MVTTRLTLATYNAVQITKLEDQVNMQDQKLDHLINITKLHEAHFKAVDEKVDKISNSLANLIKVDKTHFMKFTNYTEQQFTATMAILELLIQTTYNHRLSPGALHHNAFVTFVDYTNKLTTDSDLFSIVKELDYLFLFETSYIYKPKRTLL